MNNIIKADKNHIEDILKITKDAFLNYQKQLNCNISLEALTETYEDVLSDIKNNNVYVALLDEKIIGCIRFCSLSNDLAYI
ncbi:MAG: GNAT family N-acetyltransferase, partial [Firmicutes bacterium]|nr:GNAT family N-acetyltransferase [Bacillota bacterium]